MGNREVGIVSHPARLVVFIVRRGRIFDPWLGVAVNSSLREGGAGGKFSPTVRSILLIVYRIHIFAVVDDIIFPRSWGSLTHALISTTSRVVGYLTKQEARNTMIKGQGHTVVAGGMQAAKTDFNK